MRRTWKQVVILFVTVLISLVVFDWLTSDDSEGPASFVGDLGSSVGDLFGSVGFESSEDRFRRWAREGNCSCEFDRDGIRFIAERDYGRCCLAQFCVEDFERNRAFCSQY